jgi:hypothetical protein
MSAERMENKFMNCLKKKVNGRIHSDIVRESFRAAFVLPFVFLLVGVQPNARAQNAASRIAGSPYPVSQIPDKLYVVKSQNFSESELLTINTLQGILAKKKPAIYREHGDGYPLWITDLVANYNILVDNTFISDFKGLVNNFKSELSGYILCNLHDNSANVAISLSGPLNAIAVTNDKVTVMAELGIAQLQDVRTKDETWAFNQYKDQYSKKIVSYQKEAKDLYLSDYSTFANAFHFFDTPSSALTTSAYSRIDVNGIMLGWGDDEKQTVAKATQHSMMVNPADWALNLSTLSNIEATAKQKRHITEVETVEKVHTVCFLMSDGDNVQWLLNDFGTNSRWLANTKRGQANIGWTISPSMAELAPSVLSYLYKHAAHTEKGSDYFVAGPSGIGYFYPEQHPNLTSAASLLNEYMKKADLSIVNVIANDDSEQYMKPYVEQEAIDAIFLYTYDSYSGLAGKITCNNGKPVIGGRYELRGGVETAESLAGRLNRMPKTPRAETGYSLIPVHVWTKSVDDVMQCISLLNGNVRVVAPDEFVALIKKNICDVVLDANSDPVEKEVVLHQNFPNPTEDCTTIHYFIPKRGDVVLKLIDASGQTMRLIESGQNKFSGWHSVQLNTKGLAAGVYSYRLEVNGAIQAPPKSMFIK